MKIRFLLLILFSVLFITPICAAKTDYFTCELDLVSENGEDSNKPWKPSFLTPECFAIYQKKTADPKGYELYENEANHFKNFLVALEMYEVKKSGAGLCANNNYAIFLKDRKEFYKQSNLCICYKTNNKESFLTCLVEKRKQLVKIINNN
ncbi:uncharacterized protein LOC129245681 [Anastrepha obliqua]|uniref:uncharacterized protein LOC129245681 n=1 Tax=Anastrepha obliqua TaxID=95512 RepID=UPI0024094D14|nr:uncharacterized protein LOC129245681 [Anastrepha obliqua]